MLTADRFAYSKFWALRYKRTEYGCGASFSTYLSVTYYVSGDFSGDSVVKNPPAMQEVQEKQVPPLGMEDPPEEGRAIHSSILAWRIHGQRSLAGYSPQGRKESDLTE